jgi:hypothetical protein
MRSVVTAASLLAGALLLTPAASGAQDPETQPPPKARAVERPVRAPVPDASPSPGEVRSTGDRAVPRAAARAESSRDSSEEQAQRRGAVRRPASERSGARPVDRAVPRTEAPRPPQTRTTIVRRYPYRYPNYSRYYDPWGYGSFGLGYAYYSPWNWVPYAGYGYGYPYPRYGGAFGFDVGSVRLKVQPRDAEVWVDGYYAGIVDDFDGIFQALKLDMGAYRIEIRKAGFETLRFDVRVPPDRTITFRGELKLLP